jgi:hypothetical protein
MPGTFVDMAGNSALRAGLHRHFGDQMKCSVRVGLTHRATEPDRPRWSRCGEFISTR